MKLRKNENESFLSSSVDTAHDKQQDHNVTKVKIPYFFTVTIRDKTVTETATYDVISKEPFPKKWDIVEKKPVTLQFTNKCQKCGNQGTPRVDKKGMGNYHYTSRSNTKSPSNQKEQYRLIYFHKQEDKKYKPCIIASFDKNHGIFTKKGKLSKRAHDSIFPNYLFTNI